MIRRPPRSTLSSSSAASDVYKRQVEIVRFGKALGGEEATFYGLAGLGDLILTATDNQSRNRRFGLAIGKNMSIEQAEKEVKQCVEGLRNCAEVYQLAQELGIEMPITEQVYK